MGKTTTPVSHLGWEEIPADHRDALIGKLTGMWDVPGDDQAFESLSVAGQQALLIILARLREKDLWHLVERISNVWGEGGVGFEFTASPAIKSTLLHRNDFTRRFAKHRNTDGGFLEKGRALSVMHFLYIEGTPPKWSFHFDRYNPLYSPVGAWQHFRHEVVSASKPDWRTIQRGLQT